MYKSKLVFITGLGHRARVAAQTSLLLGALAMLFSPSVFAASTVTLAWNASTSTNIAGYKIYYGTSSHNYTGTLSVSNATSGIISNLATGTTYYFAATAIDG